MMKNFFAARSGDSGVSQVTGKEALLATFALGLLLGLWLGQWGERRLSKDLRALERRIEGLEMEHTILQPSRNSGQGAEPAGRPVNAWSGCKICYAPPTSS